MRNKYIVYLFVLFASIFACFLIIFKKSNTNTNKETLEDKPLNHEDYTYDKDGIFAQERILENGSLICSKDKSEKYIYQNQFFGNESSLKIFKYKDIASEDFNKCELSKYHPIFDVKKYGDYVHDIFFEFDGKLISAKPFLEDEMGKRYLNSNASGNFEIAIDLLDVDKIVAIETDIMTAPMACDDGFKRVIFLRNYKGMKKGQVVTGTLDIKTNQIQAALCEDQDIIKSPNSAWSKITKNEDGQYTDPEGICAGEKGVNGDGQKIDIIERLNTGNYYEGFYILSPTTIHIDTGSVTKQEYLCIGY